MGKKKSSNTFNQESKSNKNTELEKDGIIVLNEGKVVDEEELDILGTSGEVQEVTVDTSYLDEELGISDVFKENGIGLMQIGDKGKNKEKKNEKVVEVKSSNKDKEEKADLDQIIKVYSMVLKNNAFEPIPYPFDNDNEFEKCFQEAIQSVDHMAISKFSRNNPELNLRDAFKHVFTVPENYNVKSGKKEKNIIDAVTEIVESKEEPKQKEVQEEEKPLDKRLKSIVEKSRSEIEAVLSEVISKGDKEPEVVLETLLKCSADLESKAIGKLVKAITSQSISDIVRAEINGNSEMNNIIEEGLKTFLSKLESKISDLETKLLDDKLTDDEFIQEILNAVEPVDIHSVPIMELVKMRESIAPNMSEDEFISWVVDERKKKKKDKNVEKSNKAGSSNKAKTVEKDPREHYNNALSSAMSIFNMLGSRAAL